VLTHAKDNSNLHLGEYIQQIDAIGTEIRKSQGVKIIGARCPTYPITRFFYIVLKMKFILERREAIYNYYQRYEYLII
jgi:hypothetical protein